jgi:hypothetical protein
MLKLLIIYLKLVRIYIKMVGLDNQQYIQPVSLKIHYFSDIFNLYYSCNWWSSNSWYFIKSWNDDWMFMLRITSSCTWTSSTGINIIRRLKTVNTLTHMLSISLIKNKIEQCRLIIRCVHNGFLLPIYQSKILIFANIISFFLLYSYTKCWLLY